MSLAWHLCTSYVYKTIDCQHKKQKVDDRNVINLALFCVLLVVLAPLEVWKIRTTTAKKRMAKEITGLVCCIAQCMDACYRWMHYTEVSEYCTIPESPSNNKQKRQIDFLVPCFTDTSAFIEDEFDKGIPVSYNQRDLLLYASGIGCHGPATCLTH